jgi:hypothetical protein
MQQRIFQGPNGVLFTAPVNAGGIGSEMLSHELNVAGIHRFENVGFASDAGQGSSLQRRVN